MIFSANKPPENEFSKALSKAYRQDEATCVKSLLRQAELPADAKQRIYKTAEKLVTGTRKNRKKFVGLDSFLQQYDLSSEEGIALMCMAEALLRIPDNETIDKLISDKISTADWQKHLNASDSLFVNATTWSLLLTGKLYAGHLTDKKTLGASLKRIISRSSSAVIRPIILQGMKIIGKQFVMGRTIDEALQRAKKLEAAGYRYSYDMLGEAARTQHDAEIYLQSYENAIQEIGKASNGSGHINGPGISIKLSALHPRYEYAKRERVLNELTPKLLKLAQLAKAQNIGLTVDAEEADRLELSLEVIEKVFNDPSLNGWEGFGLAVQSYQKRAPYVIDFLINITQKQKRKMMVRLIKGAYWDAEIKLSQVLGLEGYPVFTRKASTDVSFIACAKKILAHPKSFYAQFGTHNAHSVATILELAKNRNDFEFQCLHGMGQPLYDQIVGAKNLNIPVRIYAPVGSHKDLLGYLVRRLLENGANTSFINRIADENAPVAKLIADPVDRVKELKTAPHPYIPLPKDIYQPERKNSQGIDLSNTATVLNLQKDMEKFDKTVWEAAPLINGKFNASKTDAKNILAPANLDRIVGHVTEATAADVDEAVTIAYAARERWSDTPVKERTEILDKCAELLEANMPRLMTILTREGGKQIVDTVSEIREAVDFARYYAARARHDLVPTILPGPTGEFNQLQLHGRGVIVCISPWNFPLAIFAGQILAALAAGNCVIAKPAEQTPLVAAETIKLFHEAGVPKDVLHLLPGRGEIVGEKLVNDERVAGVMFTGSTEVAKIINQGLAKRKGGIVPLVAETGGQNAMIVDSSALPEQVVVDVLSSSFNSAGQRCSALRVLFLQDEIADKTIEMLKGAMAELQAGDPSLLTTDVGPVIDNDALQMLEKHSEQMKAQGKLVYELPISKANGYFFAPRIFELNNLSELQKEVFGPILHIIRYKAADLPKVLDQIIATEYGLTLGIHSRIDNTVDYIQSRMPVGNIYVNRNIIGAVVGVQPFGGERLSGTGPKAGGPHYLTRLCLERAISINTTAAGGNTTLVSLSEDD